MKRVLFITILLGALVSVNAQTLIEFAKDNNTDEVLSLLKKGVKDTQDENGFNALIWACRYENVVLVEALLKSGSDPCAYTGNSFQFPLLYAARFNVGTDVLKILLKTNAKYQINTFGHDGFTPLIAAAKANNLEACKLLLANGAIKYFKTGEGYFTWEYSTVPEIQELLKP